jgi:glutamine---fructose-6-phosphate transaminase (isomerizing)
MAGLMELGDKLLFKYEDLAKKLGENHDVNQFFFLGNGRNYGLASEASLKLKEMALTVSEPFHFLEFRHGPKSMVNEKPW